jgi:sortase A
VILLLAVGLTCLALFSFYAIEARRSQASLSHTFDEQRQRAAERSPLAAHRESGQDLIGRLEIPRIGLNVMVLNGVDPATLRRAAGWMPETALPGNAGNSAIAAHRDTHFRPLRQVRKGDVIRVTTLDARYDYRVQWMAVVAPDDISVLAPTGKRSLTLITCYPFYYVGSAPQRFIVRAIQQDAPPGQSQLN